MARLHKEIAEAVAQPSLKETYAAVGAEAELSTPQEFVARIRADFDRWSVVIKQAGISAQQ